MPSRTDNEPKPTLAEAMYPKLSEKAKAKDELRARERERTLRDLRELNERLAKLKGGK
jgi:hypothetical protein